MVRSLWTAATGMNGQQSNIDAISNNLSYPSYAVLSFLTATCKFHLLNNEQINYLLDEKNKINFIKKY